jgi:hypothetical protein
VKFLFQKKKKTGEVVICVKSFLQGKNTGEFVLCVEVAKLLTMPVNQ